MAEDPSDPSDSLLSDSDLLPPAAETLWKKGAVPLAEGVKPPAPSTSPGFVLRRENLKVKVEEAEIAGPPPPEVIPATEAERANGWEDMTLSRYVKERDLAAAEKIDPHSASNQRLRRPTRRAGRRWNFPAGGSWQR